MTIKEKPILFSTPMVQAILEGRKTQTRWVIKPQPFVSRTIDGVETLVNMSKQKRYKKDDILWVRETWADYYKSLDVTDNSDPHEYIYKASDEIHANHWKSSIFMPREAARLFLKVKRVTIERVQDITEADAKAEGIASDGHEAAVISFSRMWDTLNAKRGYLWESNPWVCVIEFERSEKCR